MLVRCFSLLLKFAAAAAWAPKYVRWVEIPTTRRLVHRRSQTESATTEAVNQLGACLVRETPNTEILGWLANDWARTVSRHNADMPCKELTLLNFDSI